MKGRILSLLKEEIEDLKIGMVEKEFHYGHCGFNSCHTSKVVGIITKDADFVPKTGVVKEKYDLVGSNKLEEVLLKYPNYELYLRRGYSFRGAGERLVDIEMLRKEVSNSAACDIEVKDNEILAKQVQELLEHNKELSARIEQLESHTSKRFWSRFWGK